LIAKNAFAQQIVSEQMQANEVDKFYLAIVAGELKDDQGTIDLPIDREAALDIRRIVIDTGLASVTHYEVLERFKGYTFVKISLETGRTHQIRVHFSHIGHPILGDHLYGQISDMIDRQALHCHEMSFKPPREKAKVSVVCNLPDDINNVLDLLRKELPM
jgi:23S rRNA pseudouridine1911/1915/1917 synthase